MKTFLLKRLIRIFFYSLIWLTVPAAIIFIPDMYEERVRAGEFLTPYSVNVRGYYRKDGSYVRPHSRRPPGSVAHDAPYEAKRNSLFLGITTLVIFSLGSSGGFAFFTCKEIKERKKNFQEHIEKALLSKMNIDFSDLAEKPRHLVNRLISRYDTYKAYNCIKCERRILWHEFHYSTMATRNPSKTCIDCMLKNKIFYKEELAYVWHFENRLENWLAMFKKMNQIFYPKTIVDIKNIEEFFYQSVKELRKKTKSNE